MNYVANLERWLTEKHTRITQLEAEKAELEQELKNAKSIIHCHKASERVKTWPEWKQALYGPSDAMKAAMKHIEKLEAQVGELAGALKNLKNYPLTFTPKELSERIDKALQPHQATIKRIQVRDRVVEMALEYSKSYGHPGNFTCQEGLKRDENLREAVEAYEALEESL